MPPIRTTILGMLTVLCSALTVQALAEDLATYSLRYLTIEADQIILADPVDPKPGIFPDRYKTIRTLHGSDIRVGQEFVIRNGTLYSLEPREWLQKPGEKKAVAKMVKTLLFLDRRIEEIDGNGYRTIPSGIRALGENKEVLVPQQLMNPGPYHLLPSQKEDWDEMLTQVKRDLPVIAQIRKFGTIEDPQRRNEAIFKWIEEHKDEFGGGYFGNEVKGWPSLEPRLFEWVMASCIPEDCWRAIELSVDVGSWPERTFPSFCSPRGRELLIEKFADESLSDLLRLSALRQLGAFSTLWYVDSKRYPNAQIVTQEEQDAIIDLVLPLLRHEQSLWRVAGAQCLFNVSWSGDANFSDRVSQRGLPGFEAVYRGERNTSVRNVVVTAIRRIGGESYWEKVSGNPKGIVVFLWRSGIERGVMEFQMLLEYTDAKITEPPVFRFQKLDENGGITGSLSLKPTVKSPEDLFTKGWSDHFGSVSMTVPIEHLKPGLWRVILTGKWESHPWTSEPVEVWIPKTMKDE